MDHFSFAHTQVSATLGVVFGTITALIRTVVLLVEQASILTLQAIIDTFILGCIGALAGLLMTAVVKWLKNKWLGIKK